MPEAYTHIRIARNALQSAQIDCECQAAFEMGANGPDPLFAYNVLSRRPQYPMAKIGSRLHKDRCGAFLCALVAYSTTPAQRSYTMGFLSHNATDALLHPYVTFITSAGQRYNRPSGHGFFEIAFDCTLYKKDRGTRCIPAKDTAPELSLQEIADICVLIEKSYTKVFGEEISLEGIADSFHHFRALHRVFISKCGFKKAIGFIVDTFILRRPGFAVSHMTPAKLSKHIPDKWINPFTGDTISGTAFELLEPAEQVSLAFLKSAYGYWHGQLSFLQLTRLIGDHSYETGLEGTFPQELDKNSELDYEQGNEEPQG